MKNVIREYFPGSNTPVGFFPYYEHILKTNEAKKIIILKGGPGTGKSTFMKRIARHVLSLGYEIELLHCSSDPNSLDGVCVRDIGFLIVDGTSPHIVDPKAAGAVEEIINLGDCWDKDEIKKNKNLIIDTSNKISKSFKKSYQYLAASKNIQNNIELEVENVSQKNIIKDVFNNIKKDFPTSPISNEYGTERKAFLSAITPVGKKNYIDTYIQNSEYTHIIKSDFGPSSSILLYRLKEMFIENGYEVRSFYCPTSPDNKIEHIYIPDLSAFFTTQNTHHYPQTVEFSNETDLCIYSNSNLLTAEIRDNIALYNSLLDKAISHIADAKKLHDELEKYYIPYMDFDKIEALCTDVINKIK